MLDLLAGGNVGVGVEGVADCSAGPKELLAAGNSVAVTNDQIFG